MDLQELSKSVLSGFDLKEELERQLKAGGVTYIKEKKEHRVSGLGEGEHLNARDLDSKYLLISLLSVRGEEALRGLWLKAACIICAPTWC